MKTLTLNAYSKNHGDASIELSFEKITTTFNGVNSYRIKIAILTNGFAFGDQTSGYKFDGEEMIKNSTSEKSGIELMLDSKKALTRLGSEHLVIYKEGSDRTKNDRFIVSFFGVDLNKLKNDL